MLKSCNNKACNNKACEHFYPHAYLFSCHKSTCCYLGDTSIVCCEPSLSEIRKEKLKNLKNAGNLRKI